MAPRIAFAVALLQLVGAARVTPVQQVTSMLGEMKSKGAAAMAQEKMLFASYSEWVNDRVVDTGHAIQTTEGEIERLVAFIEKTDSTISSLASAIADVDQETGRLEADKKGATEQREEEHDEYVKVQEDYAESVDALERAIHMMKAQDYDRPQALMMLQKMAADTKGMRRVLAAFLEEKEVQDGAPAVAAYAFQSDSIVALLEKLLAKFKGELDNTETEESNAAHAFDLQSMHLGNVIDRLNADRNEKTAMKGKADAASGNAKGELASARTDLAEDQKLLADTKATFAVKSRAFEENQKVRAEEIEALGKAIEIISNPNVAASYSEHINLAQAAARPVNKHEVSFLQERSQTALGRRARAVAFLKDRAASLASHDLAALAREVTANPFAKVIEMIESMLAKMKEEAAAEADHKAWCDDELNKNKIKREKITATVGRLRAESDQLGAQIQSLADEISTLSADQAALAKAMSEGTATRSKEKAANTATIADAQAAIQAVKQALVILREFYSTQEAPAALLQQKQVPEMSAYKGQQGSKGGVIGMLEVIESDFSRLEADTKAEEGAAANEYASFMADSKASKKTKHDREFKLSLEKDQAEFDHGRVNDDLALSEESLAKANGYFQTLKPSCLEVHVSYEERTARRKEEIEALKEAYKILDGGSVS